MAQSDKIGKSRKRKLMLDNGIYELDAEDCTPVNSPGATTPDPTETDVILLGNSCESNAVEKVDKDADQSFSGTPGVLEETVGPGDAPEGYILLEEDVGEPQSQPRKDDAPRPIFKVMFRDKNVARQHRKQVEHFLQSLVSSVTEVRRDSNTSDLVLEIWERDVSSKGPDVVDIWETESEESQEPHNDELFMIDTKPKLKDDLDIPTYGKKFEKVFEKPKLVVAKSDPKADCGPKLECFNCLGNHNLRDCPEPRNPNNINKNRKEFNSKMGPRNSRYHLEDNQRFGHFVPGQLSKNLRKALGLRDYELPKHIYRMRILGYPPGWLEEARVQHSGLTLFNSDGNAEMDPTDEEGEIIATGAKDQFDTKKIHDFPGFNVAIPPGVRDEYKYYRVPKIQLEQSKEAMLSQLIGRQVDDGYKRKKLKLTRPATAPDVIVVPSKMEVVDVDDDVVESISANGLFVPPLPKDTPPRPPEPPTVPDPTTLLEDPDSQRPEPQSPDSMNQSTAPSSRANSPSLSDLECAKKQLLEELDDSSLQSNPGTPMKPGPSTSASNTPDTGMPSSSIDTTPQHSRVQSSQITPNNNPGMVKSVDMGTPVLQSTSPYNKLPASEKFSKNICELMNFENLPDSTGKYEQMSGIIQKVRNAVARFQQE